MAIVQAEGVNESTGVQEFPVAPAGIYNATITKANFTQVKKDGSAFLGAHMLNLTFKMEMEDGEAINCRGMWMLPHDGHDERGKRNAAAALKQLQVATNTEEMGDNIDDELFMHCDCRVEVKEGTYNDSPCNVLKEVLPV